MAGNDPIIMWNLDSGTTRRKRDNISNAKDQSDACREINVTIGIR